MSNDFQIFYGLALYVTAVGVSLTVRKQLTEEVMLTDEHFARASLMLSSQFWGKIGGLCAPLAVTYGHTVDDVNYYPKRDNKLPWVQLMNTGREHWVTAIFLDGNFILSYI